MAKSKGKTQRKRWRKIDTQDVADANEKRTREEQQGLLVDAFPDADLFFVDKAPDEDTAAAVEQGKLPRKMQARQRPTRAQAILQAAHSARPVSLSLPAKRAGTAVVASSAGRAAVGVGGKRRFTHPAEPPLVDLWADDDAAAAPVRKKSHKPMLPRLPAAPAVAVDGPGCSYNPDRELHQEVVAAAVAAELKKGTDRDLLPTAPIAVVDYDPETDELALLQVDAEPDDGGSGGARLQDDGAGEGGSDRARGGKAKQKTTKDRNRAARRRGLDEAEERQRRDKRQRRDLSQLKAIGAEVDAELAGRAARAARRQADAEERSASEPPRLGKQRFEPLPLQVLATREIEAGKGSLRRLKPTSVLAKERFKSLQRRGMIEPRRKVVRKKGKKVEFIHGQRSGKAEERQAEVEALRQAGQKRARAAKKAKVEGW